MRQYEYVSVTLSDGSVREGFLVDVDGDVGTLVGSEGNTAFFLPGSHIEVVGNDVQGERAEADRVEQ